MNTLLSRLVLQSFRSYSSLELSFNKSFVILHGPNGAGKTNILEAISLFTPGKGMRKADFKEIQQQNSTKPWAVSMEINGNALGTGMADMEAKKRLWILNNEPMRGQKTLNDLVRLFWLTPETDRLFLDSPSKRRQFIDRMIFVIHPEHAVVVKAYEHAVKERLNLLVNGGDAAWIEKVEVHVAENGLKMAQARAEFLKILPFDESLMTYMEGAAENILSVDAYLSELRKYRPRDAASGMTLFGPHRSDMQVVYVPKSQKAAHCSTGEQKMLLAKMVIAFLKYLQANLTIPLLLLFDDVISHLDFDNRVLLFKQLLELQNCNNKSDLIQVFFTSTESDAFEPIKDHTDYFAVNHSQIRTSL